MSCRSTSLLMTPGYVTDAMGFLLLVPALRLAIAHAAFRSMIKSADVRVMRETDVRENGGVVIEGEAVELTDKD
jgi:UPF0716 protein FxsA